MTPSPQDLEQSSSFPKLQPIGQQPSAAIQSTIVTCSHFAVHDLASPASVERTHIIVALQVSSVGHCSGGSQVSLPSSTPFPHSALPEPVPATADMPPALDPDPPCAEGIATPDVFPARGPLALVPPVSDGIVPVAAF